MAGNEQEHTRGASELPSVSVIVPTYRYATKLETTLRAFLPELLADNVTGLLVETMRLAEAIECLLANPQRREEMARLRKRDDLPSVSTTRR
jgi:hypothetical protein